MTFLLLAAAALVNGVIGAEVRIKNVDEFIEFKDNVNSGTNYSGTTVFLDSDLSLARTTFGLIGTYDHYFLGTFDGQGHVISNLAMNSSLEYVGIFGYSTGLTIKNVILDSSCSISSSYSGSNNAYIGGFIGDCYADNGPCTIENSVNTGSVSFSGNISDKTLYLGGITGRLYSYNLDSTVKNCANYGGVTQSGESKWSYIGGIVGHSYGSSSKPVSIYNCLNHGTMTHKNTTENMRIGGIAGNTYSTIIENCVSGGKISSLTTVSKKNYIGSIVGYVNYGTTISYTYYTSDLSGYNKYGYKSSTLSESNTLNYDSTTFELNGTVSIGGYTGTSLVYVLNAAADYYTLRDYSHWLLNKGKNAVTFTINKNPPFALNFQIILLPSLASEENKSFLWYTDDEFTTPLTEFEVTSETELYGSFCSLPNYTADPVRAGYSFAGWDKNITNMPADNTTITAQWTANNFTVTFNPSGGSVSQSTTKVVTFGSAYGELPTPNKTEHTFLGWFNEKNESITEESIVEIPDSHTLFAHWLEFSPGQVEIVFSTKDMTKAKVTEIINKYTDAEFTINAIESITDEVRVIVEFVDSEKAKNFIEKVDASSEAIMRVRPIQDFNSFSPAYHQMNLLDLK